MRSPTWLQMPRNAAVEPVKWTPARSGLASAAGTRSGPEPCTRFTTPAGRPAAWSSRIAWWAARAADSDGFHTTVQPISAALAGRLAAIDVKLKGVTARTKPSRGRYSIRFQTPADDSG